MISTHKATHRKSTHTGSATDSTKPASHADHDTHPHTYPARQPLLLTLTIACTPHQCSPYDRIHTCTAVAPPRPSSSTCHAVLGSTAAADMTPRVGEQLSQRSATATRLPIVSAARARQQQCVSPQHQQGLHTHSTATEVSTNAAASPATRKRSIPHPHVRHRSCMRRSCERTAAAVTAR